MSGKKILIGALMLLVISGIGGATVWWLSSADSDQSLLSPFGDIGRSPDTPLNRYAISELANYPYTPSALRLGEQLPSTANVDRYQFTFTTTNATMSGVITYPATIQPNTPVILMLRGYVPPENYTPGTGTQPAANAFAEAGMITVAPDFFGVANSSPEPADSWETRFIKPVNAIELYKSIQEFGVPKLELSSTHRPKQIGMWAHSNGGQVAITMLEVLRQPIPTTLWAPVTVPFPYSILFFSDEHDDEGKAMRQWLSQFEQLYDVFDFSLTKHLNQLTGPLQLHHGTADEAAPIVWSNEFVDKIETENARREELLAEIEALAASASALPATMSADIEIPQPPLPLIELTYYTYPGADHNMRPNWDQVVERDIEFFNSLFK